MPVVTLWLKLAIVALFLAGCVVPFYESESLPEGMMQSVPVDLRSNPAEVLVLTQTSSVSDVQGVGVSPSGKQLTSSTVVVPLFVKGTELVSLEGKLKSGSTLHVAFAVVFGPLAATETYRFLQTLCVIAEDGRLVNLSPMYDASHGVIDLRRRDASITVLRAGDTQVTEILDGPCGISGRLNCNHGSCIRAADFLSRITTSIPKPSPSDARPPIPRP